MNTNIEYVPLSLSPSQPPTNPSPFLPHRHEQLTLRADALREELHSKTERILNDIIKFKVHVQKSLEDLEGLVVDEVEGELGGEEREGGDWEVGG